MTKIVTFSLRCGSREGQETREQKRKIGLEYIEKIRQDEVIEEVREEKDKFVIYIQE